MRTNHKSCSKQITMFIITCLYMSLCTYGHCNPTITKCKSTSSSLNYSDISSSTLLMYQTRDTIKNKNIMIETIATKDPTIIEGYETDVFKTIDGKMLSITFIKHSCLLINFDNHIIYTDPVSTFADFKSLPKADVILITHEHKDHLDPVAISDLETDHTLIMANKSSHDIIGKGEWMKNGESKSPFSWIAIDAVPAYNTTPDRQKYHPPHRDNGYVLHLGGNTIYLSGDTEDIPEMANLGAIDIAFLSTNQPYTMTVPQLMHAIEMIHPQIA